MAEKKDRLPVNPLDELIRPTSNTENQDVESKDVKASKKGAEDNTSNISNMRNIEQEEKVDNLKNMNLLVARTFKVKRIWDETLDRIAFWEHEWKQDVLDKILEKALKDRVEEYPEIPEGKKGK